MQKRNHYFDLFLSYTLTSTGVWGTVAPVPMASPSAALLPRLVYRINTQSIIDALGDYENGWADWFDICSHVPYIIYNVTQEETLSIQIGQIFKLALYQLAVCWAAVSEGLVSSVVEWGTFAWRYWKLSFFVTWVGATYTGAAFLLRNGALLNCYGNLLFHSTQRNVCDFKFVQAPWVRNIWEDIPNAVVGLEMVS